MHTTPRTGNKTDKSSSGTSLTWAELIGQTDFNDSIFTRITYSSPDSVLRRRKVVHFSQNPETEDLTPPELYRITKPLNDIPCWVRDSQEERGLLSTTSFSYCNMARFAPEQHSLTRRIPPKHPALLPRSDGHYRMCSGSTLRVEDAIHPESLPGSYSIHQDNLPEPMRKRFYKGGLSAQDICIRCFINQVWETIGIDIGIPLNIFFEAPLVGIQQRALAEKYEGFLLSELGLEVFFAEKRLEKAVKTHLEGMSEQLRGSRKELRIRLLKYEESSGITDTLPYNFLEDNARLRSLLLSSDQRRSCENFILDTDRENLTSVKLYPIMLLELLRESKVRGFASRWVIAGYTP